MEYGIFASQKVGLPLSVVNAARQLRKRFLLDKEKEHQSKTPAAQTGCPRTVTDMVKQVKANSSSLSLEEKRDLLLTIRKSIFTENNEHRSASPSPRSS